MKHASFIDMQYIDEVTDDCRLQDYTGDFLRFTSTAVTQPRQKLSCMAGDSEALDLEDTTDSGWLHSTFF